MTIRASVADGPLKGRTIAQLLEQFPEQMMGKLAGRFGRFPLLLKFLDVRQMLSVQVHPTDANTDLLPAGETPKTEAWVVLEAGTESRIYAGLKPGTTAASLRHALTNGTVADQLASLTPKPGDAIFLRAGTVHSLGGDVVVFEIQQNSDVTFRLYDWNHVDPKTGKPRALQVEKAMACVDFSEGPVGRVTPVVETKTPVERERLFDCEHFRLWRLRGQSPFTVGAADFRAYWCASRVRGRSSTAMCACFCKRGRICLACGDWSVCRSTEHGERVGDRTAGLKLRNSGDEAQ